MKFTVSCIKILSRELFLGNLVSQLMKIPQFEDPINTVQNVVDNNITIFMEKRLFDNRKSFYFLQKTTQWDHVANRMVPAEVCSTNNCSNINGTYDFYVKHHLHGNKTHAIIRGILHQRDLKVMPEKKNWWRSNKLDYGKNPYGGLTTSRNWILNEVKFFTLHRLK